MKKNINNKIEESYCSFEVSKLLREKGFNVSCHSHYELALKSEKDIQDGYSGPFGWKKGEFNVKSDYNTNKILDNYYNEKTWYACSRPTQSVAIKWIWSNFKIWITVKKDWDEGKFLGYEAIIETRDGFINVETFKTPEITINKALFSVLSNIIK